MKKVKLLFRVVASLVLAVSIISQPVLAGDVNKGDSYFYDFWGLVKPSLSAFEFADTIGASNMGGIKLASIDDVCTYKTNPEREKQDRIVIVDSLESRVNVFDENGEMITSIKAVKDENNKIVMVGNAQLVLKNPEGAFVHEKRNELYIADTGAERIVVLDSNTFLFKRLIKAPVNLIGQTTFKPSKIAVDKADRIYVVVSSSFEGIIELNYDGSFSRYFGVNKPSVNIIDVFWKSISTDKQKEKMAKVFAPAFNNVEVDSEGFVYATTFDNAAVDSVFRLNPKGENVLREFGYTDVIGDISMNGETSKLVDIAVTDYGTYAVVDKQAGRIFIYNFDGELINIFGSLGDKKGAFKNPTSIAWLNGGLIVADKDLCEVYMFDRTDFGNAALNGGEQYYYGNWEDAGDYFREAIKLNSNYDIAYVGLGKQYLMQNDYENAMYYFKYGNNREYYSKAYNEYRNIVLQENFAYVLIIAVLLIGALFYSEYRYMKKRGEKA